MTFLCILLPDGYAFYEVSTLIHKEGWLLPRSNIIAHVNGIPIKPHRVVVDHRVHPDRLVRTYARRRGLLDYNLQVLDPLGLEG